MQVFKIWDFLSKFWSVSPTLLLKVVHFLIKNNIIKQSPNLRTKKSPLLVLLDSSIF